MDDNRGRPTQGEPSMDDGGWRTQLMPDSRQRIVDKIMETLKRHLPIPGPEGLVELRKIAVRFEEKIYAAATSQSDYLRKISLKMLTMETKSQGGVNNSLPCNPVGNQNPLDTGLQPQVRNPGQSLQIPLGNQSQQRQQLLPQNLQNAIASAAAQASLDSTPLTGLVGVVDCQEEVYQMIKSMKEMYLPELNEVYQNIALKCQQHEGLGTQSKQSDPMEKLKLFKVMLERMITFLQVPKNCITPTYKEKLAQIEQQIVGVLSPYRNRFKKPATSQQLGRQQLQQSVGQSHSMTQQSQSQISQLQQHDNLANSMPMNMQGSVTSMESTAVSNLPHGSMALSAHMGVPATQQNMMNALQSNSNLELGAGRTMNSLPLCVFGSLRQNTFNASQQNNMNQLQPNVSSLQSNSNILQPQQLKQQQQEQQLMPSQQLMQQQYQQHHMLQLQQTWQHVQQQQILQQFKLQQLQQQLKQQQSSQLQSQQVPQLHQMSEANDLKVRAGFSVKPGLFPQIHAPGQLPTPYHQQVKTSPHFPISSLQLLQAACSQLSQHSSPQIGQQNLLSALPKTGTPFQSANSPFSGTSPSTPAAPSLTIQADSEKRPPRIPSASSAGNIGHQQASHVLTETKSLAIGAPGTLASPLLAGFTGLDGNQGTAPTNKFGKSSITADSLCTSIFIVLFVIIFVVSFWYGYEL